MASFSEIATNSEGLVSAIPDSGWILVLESGGPPGRRLALVRSVPMPRDTATDPSFGATLGRPRAVLVEAPRTAADGWAALESLRGAGLLGAVPIVVAGPLDVVRELADAPVDDFVTTPYAHDELHERIRRAEQRWKARPPEGVLAYGRLRIDLRAQSASLGGERIALTRREYGLLAFFFQNPGVLFERGTILARVWGAATQAGLRTIDIHVRRLRAKIGLSELPLETVRGTGYRLRLDDGATADAAPTSGIHPGVFSGALTPSVSVPNVASATA